MHVCPLSLSSKVCGFCLGVGVQAVPVLHPEELSLVPSRPASLSIKSLEGPLETIQTNAQAVVPFAMV